MNPERLSDAQRLRDIADSMLRSSTDAAASRSAAELLKLASDIEKQDAEARKLALDEAKLKHELQHSRRNRQSDDLKAYITLLAPVFTTLVLVGTLIFQYYQFHQDQKDKGEATKQQAHAEEDREFAEAFKLTAQSENISPATVFLRTWGARPGYADQARAAAKELLLKPQGISAFAGLFNSLYDSVTPDNLPEIIDMNRSLRQILGTLWTAPAGSLTTDQRQTFTYLTDQINFISAKICPFLKDRKIGPAKIDLRSTRLTNCDLQNADFSRVDLTDAHVVSDTIKGANLSGLDGFYGVYFYETPWWEASKINRDFLEYLKAKYPYDPGQEYPSPETKAGYLAGVERLDQRASGPFSKQ